VPFDVHAVRSHNRLYLKVWGHVSPDRVFDCASATITEASKLRPGFDAILDVSGLTSLPDSCLPHVARIDEFLVSSGVRRVVRVCGRLPELVVKLERQARTTGYSAHLATSMGEAEALLDGR
jgi:hypothetical protein